MSNQSNTNPNININDPNYFDFLKNPTPDPKNPPVEQFNEPPGPNLLTNHKMKPKDMANDIFSVYRHLGGTEWLLKMSKTYPRQFLKMLEKMLPKDINLAVDSDIKVLIADTINLANSTLQPPPPKLIDATVHTPANQNSEEPTDDVK